MATTPNPPAGSHGNSTAPTKPKLDEPFSQDEPTSGPAGSTYLGQKESQPDPKAPTPPAGQQRPPQPQPAGQHAPGSPDQRINDIINSGFQAREASRPGRDAHDVADTAKDLGSKALHGIKTLSTGQLALGVGVLAAGIAFFLTKGKRKYPKVRDQRGGRHKTTGHPTGHQPHTPRGNDTRGNDTSRRGERPWGNSRFAAGPDAGAGRSGRVQAGSGYDERRGPSKGPRRDQGPANGRGYDPRRGGRQNPNNVDQPGGAY